MEKKINDELLKPQKQNHNLPFSANYKCTFIIFSKYFN